MIFTIMFGQPEKWSYLIDQIDVNGSEVANNPPIEQIEEVRSMLTDLLSSKDNSRTLVIFCRQLQLLQRKHHTFFEVHKLLSLVMEKSHDIIQVLGLGGDNLGVNLFALLGSRRRENTQMALLMMVSNTMITEQEKIHIENTIINIEDVSANMGVIINLGVNIDLNGYTIIKNIIKKIGNDNIARLCYKVCCRYITTLDIHTTPLNASNNLCYDDVRDIIDLMPNLTVLNLSNSQLTVLPAEIGGLGQLRELILSHNQLTELPPEIAQLIHLKSLNLDHNNLTTLPPEIAQLQNLEKLNLGNNRFTELPLEIAQLIHLKSLNLDHNNLTTLPPEIAQLQNLQKLSLFFNMLPVFPLEIAQLQKLAILTLTGNKFKKIPQGIILPKTLISFDLLEMKKIRM